MGWLAGFLNVVKSFLVEAAPHIAKHGSPIVTQRVGSALDRNSRNKRDALPNLIRGIEELERKLEQESGVSSRLLDSLQALHTRVCEGLDGLESELEKVREQVDQAKASIEAVRRGIKWLTFVLVSNSVVLVALLVWMIVHAR